MKAELSRVHWGRILLTSILIVILVIFVFDNRKVGLPKIWGTQSA